MFRIILVITVLEQTVVTAIRPTVTFLVLDRGGGLAEVSLVGFSFAAASLVTSWLGGGLINLIGPQRTSLAGATCLAGGCAVLLLWSTTTGPVLVSQVLMGAGQSAVVLSTQALLARFHEGPDHGYGTYSAVASGGQIVGPLLPSAVMVVSGATGGSGSYGPSFALSALLGILLVGASASLPRLRYQRPPDTGRPWWGGVTETLHTPLLPSAIICSALLSISMDLFTVYLPALANHAGWSPALAGLLLAGRGGASLVARMLTPPLLRALGRRRLLTICMIAPAVGLATIAIAAVLAPETPVGAGAAIVGAVLFGFWNGVGVPVTMMWVAVIATTTGQAAALGLRLTANRFGQTLVPGALTLFGSSLSVPIVFLAISATLLATAGLVQRALDSGNDT